MSLTWLTCRAAHHHVSRCPPDAGHVAEHADCPGDAAAGVEHQVLAVVSPQQLHVLRHADGADLHAVRTLELSLMVGKDFTVPGEGPREIKSTLVTILTRSMVKSSTKVETMDQTVMTSTASACTPSRYASPAQNNPS